MKHLVTFSAYGVEPTPWTVPNVGTGVSKAGKKFRFATRSKKSDPFAGTSSLRDWQRIVASAAREAMQAAGHAMPLTSPMYVHYVFYCQTPEGSCDGDLWWSGMKWVKAAKEWRKKNRENGRTDADLTNLTKGTEDSLHNVIFYDDIQVRFSSYLSLYGPAPGVKVAVYVIEPEDNFQDGALPR